MMAPGVHDDLRDRGERRVEQDVDAGEGGKRRDQQHHAVDRVPLADDEQRRSHGERAEHVEEDRLKSQSRALRPPWRAG